MRTRKVMKDENVEGVNVWVNRINKLLNEKNWTQKDLAEKSGLSPATISGWISDKKVRKNEPKAEGLDKIAKAFGVSADYLLGGNKCKTPKNEALHKITGLSDKAIEKLKKTQRDIKSSDKTKQMKLAACNLLIESIDDTPLLENLFNYLLGEHYFKSSNGKENNGASIVVTKGLDGQNEKSLLFGSAVGQAFYVEIQHDLVRLRDEIMKKRAETEKDEYDKWEAEKKETILKDLWNTMDEFETEGQSK